MRVKDFLFGGKIMGADCNNCKNKGKCGTSMDFDLIRTGGKDAFVVCKSYAPKFFSVKCPNCDCIIHVDTTSTPQTNANRIRSMTDEEMAEWFDNVCKSAYDEGYTKETDEPLMSQYPSTASEWITWLKQEANK